jgi:uncharacterized protein YecT (DUF1311 family)
MIRAFCNRFRCSGRSGEPAHFCLGLILGLGLLSGRALAYEAVCDRGPAEKHLSLAETIPRTEAEFQRIYQLAASIGDAKAKELLEKSQATWLAYRESECKLEGDATRGGSLQQMLTAECEVRLTQQRIRDLTDYIDMTAH